MNVDAGIGPLRHHKPEMRSLVIEEKRSLHATRGVSQFRNQVQVAHLLPHVGCHGKAHVKAPGVRASVSQLLLASTGVLARDPPIKHLCSESRGLVLGVCLSHGMHARALWKRGREGHDKRPIGHRPASAHEDVGHLLYAFLLVEALEPDLYGRLVKHVP